MTAHPVAGVICIRYILGFIFINTIVEPLVSADYETASFSPNNNITWDAQGRSIIPMTPPCYNNPSPIDLTALKGVYIVPSLNAPPYWSRFGNELCKWIDVTPDSADEAHYLGGYYGGNDTTLYKYTGHIQYNYTTGVYDAEEQFITRNTVSIFTTTPCIVSKNTFVMYLPFPTNSTAKPCSSQTFVFSRNYKTAMEDDGPIRTKCLDKFNIPRPEQPFYSNGCRDTGLYQDYQ